MKKDSQNDIVCVASNGIMIFVSNNDISNNDIMILSHNLVHRTKFRFFIRFLLNFLKILVIPLVIDLIRSKNGPKLPILHRQQYIPNQNICNNQNICYKELNSGSLDKIFKFFGNFNFTGSPLSLDICDLVINEFHSIFYVTFLS